MMIVERLEAVGFRNLQGSSQFAPGLNIFYGDNAQGKTNWLEAIYVLGSTRSFRTKQLRDVIAFGQESCILRGDVRRGSLAKQLQALVTPASKEFFVNAKREALLRYIGNLDLFVFSLEEMEIIRGEPGGRRRFIDRGIVTITPAYLGTVSEYNRVIKQKNRLLAAAFDSPDPQAFRRQIEAWNDRLVELGGEIHRARVEYVERLGRVLEENDQGRAIFGAERINIRYRSSLEGKGDLNRYEELFRERLGLRLEAEMAAGCALIGPQRDELEVFADGRDVGRFGSAGQQRSALFLLDLAQVYIYNSIYEESPVLLIDDIDAELDRGRIEAVLSALEGRIQTFVSTSRRGIADRYRDRASVYLVEGGKAAGEPSRNVEAAGTVPREGSDKTREAVSVEEDKGGDG